MTLLDDVRLVRRGWRWGDVRPAGWPEAEGFLPGREADLSWARQEPVRTLRLFIQRGLMQPVNELMTHPLVRGREWVRGLDEPVLLAANHVSHADTQLLLGALPDAVREHTVVAAAQDYFYDRPVLGRLLSLYLNTFPFSRTGGAQAVLHASRQLLKAGWNLLIYPEGTRSADGRVGPFKAGIGHLAVETRTRVVPMHISGTTRVLPRGSRIPLPGPVEIAIGKPLTPAGKENARDFTARVELAVRRLGADPSAPESAGSWIERWRAAGAAPTGTL